jgi:hypothetical protein
MCASEQALVHGTRNWNSSKPRRSLLYKYNNGYATWSDPASLEPMRKLASTPIQHALLRPPKVQDREPLPGLKDPGMWGDAGRAVGIGPRCAFFQTHVILLALILTV